MYVGMSYHKMMPLVCPISKCIMSNDDIKHSEHYWQYTSAAKEKAIGNESFTQHVL